MFSTHTPTPHTQYEQKKKVIYFLTLYTQNLNKTHKHAYAHGTCTRTPSITNTTTKTHITTKKTQTHTQYNLHPPLYTSVFRSFLPASMLTRTTPKKVINF